MTDPANPIPAGVRAIAIVFALCGIYLGALGLTMLARPGLISMAAGAPLLFGLELSGPYMFLLTGVVGGAIAWGLTRLNNLARHAATLAAIAGIAMLVPSVSGAVIMVQLKGLVTGGLGIIIRVMIAWYLSQGHIADEFKAPKHT
ncbi:MAG TPA: hypothetical protein VNW47_14165 [Terriglobales bacterium]|nr:hypothetical protein [Terriglobales bacterium]